MNPDIAFLWPTANAAFNAAAAFCLIQGYRAIKKKDVSHHRFWMLCAFTASIVFLVSYLCYHHQLPGGRKTYTGPQILSIFYYTILITHSIGAAVVPPAAGWALWNAVNNNIPRHVQTTRWLWPLWLFVSVTGVMIYVMLYWL